MMRPIDVLSQANGVSNFHRIDEGSCYHCRYCTIKSGNWVCDLHDIIFGESTYPQPYEPIALMAEFICDNFTNLE